MNVRLRKSIIFLLLSLWVSVVKAQSLQHPTIWITQEEREKVLNLIENYDWAESIVDQLHHRVDKKLSLHQSNPEAILDSIPSFAQSDHQVADPKADKPAAAHNKVLSIASEAGMLYFLTQDETYAMFAADILEVYFEQLGSKTPMTTTIAGNAFYDPRTTYDHIALAYDFIYNYLKKSQASVYNRELGKRIPFNNDKAQKSIENMVGNTLQEYGKKDTHGKYISNHPILTAPGVLYGILCVEDDIERERLFNVFWETGTAHQNSFKHTILTMFGEQGIWPESTSYSFMPLVTLVLNIVDRNFPEMDVTKEYKQIFNGSFLFDNLRYPDHRFVRFGDSKRNNDGTQELYRYTLDIANRRGFDNLTNQAKIALKQAYEIEGGYRPRITGNTFNNYEELQLFWGVPIPDNIDDSIDFQKPTVIIEHAGVALQRNYVKENNLLYGLCGIIGGAHYVHSHVTGITMELYGAGYVMAPNAGLPPTVAERQIPLHEHYFRLYAGNNTVIVNGTSHGLDKGSWKGKANVWQNTTLNIAAEPKHLEDPISDNFSFATQFLDDSVNHSLQQRTLSTIRTSATTGYYLDVFRSKSKENNNFHDYIYHNIGDKTYIWDTDNEKLSLKQTDRYQNDIGDVVRSPGWRYFEDTKVTDPTSETVKIRFDVNYNRKYMHMFVAGGVEREFTQALAPPTREAKNGYIDKKTQLIAIRQNGEAWARPYMSVFEPSANKSSSVKNVQPLQDGEKTIGVKVISHVGNKVITDYIISQDNAAASYINHKIDLQFVGRFGVVRITMHDAKEEVELYIGEGNQMKYKDHTLTADKSCKGYKKF
ncbi:hypothetical protein [Echinicola sp. 20G]|uniref:hypothetical protein n=1 Tax=Echinicola sp. 20G TaxID=2781961 RepID=UPI00191077AD|nr:hypothetical protein [Echinicola sp. 20G]